MKRILSIVGIIVLSLSASLAAEPRVGLNEGTLFVEGSVAFDYQLVGFEGSKQSISLNSDFGGGFLVADNLALGLKLPLQWTFLPARESDIGLSLFGTYFFDIKSIIVPYFGLNITPHYAVRAREFLLHSGFSSGILISMSESVALDVGLAPKVQFPLSEKQAWKIQIPAGFIGVRAFF